MMAYSIWVIVVLNTNERWLKSEGIISLVDPDAGQSVDWNGDGSDVGTPSVQFTCVSSCAPGETAGDYSPCYLSYDLDASILKCGSRTASTCEGLQYAETSTAAPVCYGMGNPAAGINLLHKRPYVTATQGSCGKAVNCFNHADIGVNTNNADGSVGGIGGGGAGLTTCLGDGSKLVAGSAGGNAYNPTPEEPGGDPNDPGGSGTGCPPMDESEYCCSSLLNGGTDCLYKKAHLNCGDGFFATRPASTRFCFKATHTSATNLILADQCKGGVRCCKNGSPRTGTDGIGCGCPQSVDAATGAVTCPPGEKQDIECCETTGTGARNSCGGASNNKCSSDTTQRRRRRRLFMEHMERTTSSREDDGGSNRRLRRLAETGDCPQQCKTGTTGAGTTSGGTLTCLPGKIINDMVDCIHDCNVGFVMATERFAMPDAELLETTDSSTAHGDTFLEKHVGRVCVCVCDQSHDRQAFACVAFTHSSLSSLLSPSSKRSWKFFTASISSTSSWSVAS